MIVDLGSSSCKLGKLVTTFLRSCLHLRRVRLPGLHVHGYLTMIEDPWFLGLRVHGLLAAFMKGNFSKLSDCGPFRPYSRRVKPCGVLFKDKMQSTWVSKFQTMTFYPCSEMGVSKSFAFKIIESTLQRVLKFLRPCHW